MLKELKAPQNNSNAWCSQSDRLQMTEDTLSAVRRVRREVVDGMRMLMKAAKDKKSEGNKVGVNPISCREGWSPLTNYIYMVANLSGTVLLLY